MYDVRRGSGKGHFSLAFNGASTSYLLCVLLTNWPQSLTYLQTSFLFTKGSAKATVSNTQENSYLLRSSEIAKIQERGFVLIEGDITIFSRKYHEQSSSMHMGDSSIIGGHAPPVPRDRRPC